MIKMDVACPQCGNPNLDVDPQNNVVYCKKCGFAVQVDPATGNVVPLSPGGAPTRAAGGAPAAYRGKSILGLEPLTFLMVCSIVLLVLTLMKGIDFTLFLVAEVLLLVFYFLMR
ncbi:TFIIB-type zinc ribbon-containing protein [Candidatus Micrarchaeota archaeon]|nr:TFIIB-type zinc ribbon-containing protein [Candidatus Micrarchaeota archaeon]